MKRKDVEQVFAGHPDPTRRYGGGSTRSSCEEETHLRAHRQLRTCQEAVSSLQGQIRWTFGRLRDLIDTQATRIHQLERYIAMPTSVVPGTRSEAKDPAEDEYGRELHYFCNDWPETVQCWPSVVRLLGAAGFDPEGTTNVEDSRELLVDNTVEGDWRFAGQGSGDGYSSYGRPEAYSTVSWKVRLEDCVELSADKINDRFSSFMEWIDTLAPFLDATDLRELVDEFRERHDPRSWPSYPSGIHDESDKDWRRQHLNQGFRPPRRRSPGDAVVLLVLALGEICRHPGPLPPTESLPNGERIDMSAVPGLFYYRRALEAMPDDVDIANLALAQAFLLAGLYTGQLARASESVRWFAMAGKVLRKLVDQHGLYRDSAWTVREDPEDLQEEANRCRMLFGNKLQRSVLLAAWSCLYLQDEALMGSSLMLSDLSDVRDRLPWSPSKHDRRDNNHDRHDYNHDKRDNNHDRHDKNDDGDDDDYGDPSVDSTLLFVAQVFLKRQLALVQDELYWSDYSTYSPAGIRAILQSQEPMFRSWRERLPVGLQWNDGDQPPSAISLARLREVYWGLRHEMYRPFLDFLLNVRPYLGGGVTVEQALAHGRRIAFRWADVRLFEAIAGMDEAELIDGCRMCVEAAMRNTSAFYNVPGRLVVTNIHSIAHT